MGSCLSKIQNLLRTSFAQRLLYVKTNYGLVVMMVCPEFKIRRHLSCWLSSAALNIQWWIFQLSKFIYFYNANFVYIRTFRKWCAHDSFSKTDKNVLYNFRTRDPIETRKCLFWNKLLEVVFREPYRLNEINGFEDSFRNSKNVWHFDSQHDLQNVNYRFTVYVSENQSLLSLV